MHSISLIVSTQTKWVGTCAAAAHARCTREDSFQPTDMRSKYIHFPVSGEFGAPENHPHVSDTTMIRDRRASPAVLATR
jgi:hypothetical protein